MDTNHRWLHQGHYYIKREGTVIAEHRAIMEDQLGRPLGAHEVVHHIDGDPLNNHQDNLTVMTRAEHMVYHLREMPVIPWAPEELERAIQLKRDGVKIDTIAVTISKSYYATRRRLARAKKEGLL
jgi:hypothetical protein